MQAVIGNPHDQCYAASEAVYHLAGGKGGGLTPVVGRVGDLTHWWLRDQDGMIIDPTADQFDKPWPYEDGRGCGFLTKMPSKKAQAIIDRVKENHA